MEAGLLHAVDDIREDGDSGEGIEPGATHNEARKVPKMRAKSIYIHVHLLSAATAHQLFITQSANPKGSSYLSLGTKSENPM